MNMIVRMIALWVIAIAASVSGTALAADGTAEWKGAYAYDDGRPPVHFTMTLTTKGKSITGRLEEDATFGDGTSDKLYADITGTTFGFTVTLKKKYDGTGGQKHTVAYRGTVDGKAMFGVWDVTGLKGTWYATASAK